MSLLTSFLHSQPSAQRPRSAGCQSGGVRRSTAGRPKSASPQSDRENESATTMPNTWLFEGMMSLRQQLAASEKKAIEIQQHDSVEFERFKERISKSHDAFLDVLDAYENESRLLEKQRKKAKFLELWISGLQQDLRWEHTRVENKQEEIRRLRERLGVEENKAEELQREMYRNFVSAIESSENHAAAVNELKSALVKKDEIVESLQRQYTNATQELQEERKETAILRQQIKKLEASSPRKVAGTNEDDKTKSSSKDVKGRVKTKDHSKSDKMFRRPRGPLNQKKTS